MQVVVVVVVGKTAAVTRGDCVLPDIEAHGVQRLTPAADHPLKVRKRWEGDTVSWEWGHGGNIGAMVNEARGKTPCSESPLER